MKNKGLLHEFESGSLVQGGAHDNKSCIMVSVKGKDLCITEGQWYLFDPDFWVILALILSSFTHFSS